jgi:hypothetical protein
MISMHLSLLACLEKLRDQIDNQDRQHRKRGIAINTIPLGYMDFHSCYLGNYKILVLWISARHPA